MPGILSTIAKIAFTKKAVNALKAKKEEKEENNSPQEKIEPTTGNSSGPLRSTRAIAKSLGLFAHTNASNLNLSETGGVSGATPGTKKFNDISRKQLSFIITHLINLERIGIRQVAILERMMAKTADIEPRSTLPLNKDNGAEKDKASLFSKAFKDGVSGAMALALGALRATVAFKALNAGVQVAGDIYGKYKKDGQTMNADGSPKDSRRVDGDMSVSNYTNNYLIDKEGKGKDKPYWDKKGYSIGSGHLLGIGTDPLKYDALKIGNESIDMKTLFDKNFKGLTQKQIDLLRQQDVGKLQKALQNKLDPDVYEHLTDKQKTALISRMYNLGPGSVTNNKEMLDAINQGDNTKVAELLRKGGTYATDIRTGVKEQVSSLVPRRQEEGDMYVAPEEKGTAKQANPISRGIPTIFDRFGNFVQSQYEYSKKPYENPFYDKDGTIHPFTANKYADTVQKDALKSSSNSPKVVVVPSKQTPSANPGKSGSSKSLGVPSPSDGEPILDYLMYFGIN